MPKITVLTTTCRSIYAEQIKSLQASKFTDFEWVLVDDNFEEHYEDVKNLVGTSFPFIHIPPRDKVDYFAMSMAFNTGIIRANGELVFLMNDYILTHPDTLGRHWELYQRYPKAMISGLDIWLDEPLMAGEVGEGTYHGHDYRTYLFKEGLFRWKQLEEDLYEAFRDGVQTFWAGRNDSAPLQALLDCNGFEEDFDGAWGGQDADLAQRLMTYGCRYLLDRKSVCLSRQHSKSNKTRIRSEQKQQRIQRLIDKKAANGIYRSNNKINLKEEREKLCKL